MIQFAGLAMDALKNMYGKYIEGNVQNMGQMWTRVDYVYRLIMISQNMDLPRSFDHCGNYQGKVLLKSWALSS